jgi:UDP:flavonoid glycosyltransferase YjiC (YdhE family)
MWVSPGDDHDVAGSERGGAAILEDKLAGAAGEQVYAAKAPGPGVAPSTLGSPAAHVLIEPYLPYPLLLSRCRLVVSQGGFGVLLAGLAHGLPQLVIPLGADQYGSAEAVRREPG